MGDFNGASEERAERFRTGLLAWADDNLREFPWRETRDPYEILVAEVLLQKTLATKVPAVYEKFLDRYPDLSTLSKANVDEIAELLEPLGFQNQRAKALVDIGDDFSEEGIPTEQEELSDPRYIGPYATNAVLCFAFDEPRPVVDANVVRIYNRAFGFEFSARENAAWEFAQWMLPEEDYQRFNLALVDYGAAVCVSGEPRCEECFFTDDCEYFGSQKMA